MNIVIDVHYTMEVVCVNELFFYYHYMSYVYVHIYNIICTYIHNTYLYREYYLCSTMLFTSTLRCETTPPSQVRR